MKKRHELRLHEQILLLALKDEKGTIESRAGWWSLALGGALFAELLLEGCITVSQDKKQLVDVVKRKSFGDPVLDEALDTIANAKRRRSASRWVSSLANLKRLRHRVAEGLCRRGILHDSEDTVLLIFKRKVYPTIDSGPEAKLISELREAVLSDSKELAPRTAVLVALADVTGLLKVPFQNKELKPRKARLKQIASGELIAGTASGAIQAVQAAQAAQMAVMAAVTAAITASTVATSSG